MLSIALVYDSLPLRAVSVCRDRRVALDAGIADLAAVHALVEPLAASTSVVTTREQAREEGAHVFITGDVLCEDVHGAGLSMARAEEIMRRALERGGWERAQTHSSLIPYLREEVDELVEAIEGLAVADTVTVDHLCQELSDVLLQVLFHCQIEHDQGRFGLDEVAQCFVDKMRRRAPYLFDGSTGLLDAEYQDRVWREAKAAERYR